MQPHTIKGHTGIFSLYEAIRANDDEALRELYVNNYFKTEKYILNNNGTIEQAKDIYQEAFIAVWRNIQMDKFYPENENSIEAYLLRISRNKWLDYLRSHQYKKTVELHEDIEGREEEVCIEDAEYIREVRSKFAELGEKCRKLLISFYFQKESMRTIAQKMEWTEATARNNKYRCIEKLRDLLKK